MTGPDDPKRQDPTPLTDLDGTPANEHFVDADDELDVQIAEPQPHDDEIDIPDDDGDGGEDGGEDAGEDADDDGAGEDAGDDEPDDLRGVSRKVRDRIMRERRIRDRDVTVVQEQLVAERTRRIEAEKAAAASAATVLDGQIAKTESELEKAIEEGDSKSQAKLHSQIAELRVKRNQVDEISRRIEAEATKPVAPASSGNRELDRWKARNPWFSDPSKMSARGFAIVVDQELASQGLDPTSPDYFREMDKRIAKAFPELYRGRTPRQDQPANRRRGNDRGAVQPPSSAAASGAPSGRVVLTREDIRTMRRFGLDPNKKEDKVTFAREKLAIDRRSNRR